MARPNCRLYGILLACMVLAAPSAKAQNTFEFRQMATFFPASGWNIAVANLFVDGLSDLVAMHPDDGSVWACRNDVTQFTCFPPIRLGPTSRQIAAGDMNADGRDEIFVHSGDLRGTTYALDGTAFKFTSRYGPGRPRSISLGWSILFGDFMHLSPARYGPDEMLAFRNTTGDIIVRRTGFVSRTTSYTTAGSRWGRIDPRGGWTFQPGDFDLDGRLDLMGYRFLDGTFRLCRNTGSAFACGQIWGRIPGTEKGLWSFAAGSFHKGSSRIDIVGYRPTDGTLWMGRNTGRELQFSQWATLTPTIGWTIKAGYFSPSAGHRAPASVMLYNQGDGRILVGTPVTKP